MSRYPDARYQPRAGYSPLHGIRRRWRHMCPICGYPMRQPTLADHGTERFRTRAHVIAVRTHPELWVFACNRCNSDQGSLSMPQWLEVLRRDVGTDMRARSRFLHLGRLLYRIREALPPNYHGRALLDPRPPLA